MIALSKSDILQLSKKGISEEKIRGQINIFEEGIPYVRLENAAVISNGILRLTPAEEKAMQNKFDASKDGVALLKFVPASGAASRMFKALFNFHKNFDPKKEELDGYLSRASNKSIATFFNNLEKLPFFKIVQDRIKNKAINKAEECHLFVSEMLSEDKLNYSFYPKGLLPFHKYKNHTASPFEEHLIEASKYAETGGVAHLHFTISERHKELFYKEFNSVMLRLTKHTKTSFDVSYSFQKSSTDTIAVDMNNEPIRNADGTLLFRPGGHGALIENLNEQHADIIFIKNIDNVAVSRFAEEVVRSKKILGGLLLSIQEQAHAYAKLLEENNLNGEQLHQIKSFLQDELNVRFSDTFPSFNIGQQIEILKDKINRPIRICGMVKNVGEPGGGPFWVRDRQGHISLQIIESAQVDKSNEDQLRIFNESSHFNPVDIVCGVKDFRGQKYNLLNFVDKRQGFITQKTKDGIALKALELPGLWNGAMSFWNTIFVEVPLSTFNPVKTVNDLLKPAHQV